ncbi:KGK domain-containing protein [Phormidium tenue]|uniref:KGK domain-containing protein n=1 Tax=Phormidium tenue NIES-30 TaxID=549789 RepID=A0A1U7J788_9CYAN|nr:KGK domain-containing protein [Phormidium tenue]MBD2231637.1 hypothetical protein [Phormidium tenue FACHB-1052]OKH48990.1 hypothetical protein NIES30_07355 [Phormidium tenue NIES-30]
MDIEYSGIEEDDVFEIFLQKRARHSDEILLESTGKIYRFAQIEKALKHLSSSIASNVYSSLLQNHGIDLKDNSFLSSGIVCKLLSSEHPGWKLGKLEVRIQVNFIPDAPQEAEDAGYQENDRESELDELRKVV